MKHDWVLDQDGDIDIWQLEMDPHNGPRCLRCDRAFCEHCKPEIYDEECPSQQLSFEDMHD